MSITETRRVYPRAVWTANILCLSKWPEYDLAMTRRVWLLLFAGGSFVISLAAATLTEWLLTKRIPLVGSVIGLQ